MIEILQSPPEPVATFTFEYSFHERRIVQSVAFHLADLNRTSILQTPIERALKGVADKIDKATNQIERLQRSAEQLTAMVDGTGIRISQRTLRALRDQPQQFDPLEFEPDGYVIIAGLSKQDAYALYRIFRYFDADDAREEYNKIPSESRQRFEQHFRVPFP